MPPVSRSAWAVSTEATGTDTMTAAERVREAARQDENGGRRRFDHLEGVEWRDVGVARE